MTSVTLIARKELATFFSSLAALVFMGVFLAVSLFTFFWVERFFARNIADVRPLFEWMPVLLIFLVSALTMRMWSEERSTGTLEFLMTSPVRPMHLVLGKFLTCLVLVSVALALTLPLPITVSLLGPLDWGPVIGGYVAALGLAAAYISIGLFVSVRTDSQIVSLIVAVLICGVLFLLGSDALTSLFGNKANEILRFLGTGSRFESITRGVIDLRDLYYYLSICGAFLVLNFYSLERLRWSEDGRAGKHFQWRLAAGLVVANLFVANAWLGQIGWARADLTQGAIYSISDASRSYLRRLQEPLLIRGYFSAETHPLLAPLVPRLRDLLTEYAVAGGAKVRVEFIDPVQQPELEEEANRQYGIRPVPFQTTSKYQAAITNSYFDILVKYGDEFETLGYQDLIEIKQAGESGLDVDLMNPEYKITRAIKKVLYSYRGSGAVFDGIPGTVRLEAYISPGDRLPEPLPRLRVDLEALIEEYRTEAGDKFVAQIRDPDAEGEEFALELQQTYGLRPLAIGLFDQKRFWFNLVLRSGDRAFNVPLPESLDKDGLKRAIEAELKRFTPGALRTVALYTPPSTPAMPQFAMAGAGRGPRFSLLAQTLRENAEVRIADLKDGRVPEQADILFVAAPENLDEKQVFAIDQFLMKGGTVVISTSPFKPSITRDVSLDKVRSGLRDWLAYNGMRIEETLVLDTRNAPFPVPIERDIGGFRVREIRLLDYPYFVDVRRDGLADGQAPTAGLAELTMTWASPITIDEEKSGGRAVTRLIESSAQSWTSDSANAAPDPRSDGGYGFPEAEERGRQLLAAMMEGKFTSFFADKPSPLAEDAEEAATVTDEAAETPKAPTITGVIERSPDSARIVLIASSSFLSDDVLSLASSVGRTQYLAPVRFAENVVDWSLEDRGLLAIRGRGGRFSRTLLPLAEGGQMLWEYLNYALAFLGLAGVFGVRRYTRAAAVRRHVAMLNVQGA